MIKKTISVLLLTLFIATAILPASGDKNIQKTEMGKQHLGDEQEIAADSNDIDWWPTFAHDSQNIGYTTSKAPNTNNILWSFRGSSGCFRDPAIINGKVYVATTGCTRNDWCGKFFCLDAETGNEIWSYTTSIEQFYGATIAEGRVYLGSGEWGDNRRGIIFCFDADNGSIIWEKNNLNYFCGRITYQDDKLYTCYRTNDWDTWICCLNASSGSVIWREKFNGAYLTECTPAIFENKVYYCIATSRRIQCFDANNGSLIWFWNSDKMVESGPTVIDNRIYFAEKGRGYVGPNGTVWIPGRVYCLNASTGKQIWQSKFKDTFYTTPAIAYGKLYIGSGGKKSTFYCLNITDGNIEWEYHFFNINREGLKIGGGPFGAVVADGKVYTNVAHPYIRDKIYCFNAFNGDLIWKWVEIVPWTRFYTGISIADEKLYIGFSKDFIRTSHNGFSVLHCFSDININAPDAPKIKGRKIGITDNEYKYTITTTDPNKDDVFYYISWGDGTIDEWIGPYASDEVVTVNHTWSEKGIYGIKARVKDSNGLRGPIGNLEVAIPLVYPRNFNIPLIN